MVEFSGAGFRHVDNRLMSLKLVQLGLSKAAMFSAKGEVLQPSEALRKRPVLIERGSFRPVCTVNLDMMESALRQMRQESSVEAAEEVVEIMEITMSNLVDPLSRSVDHRDFLARADMLAACGKTVLISDFSEYFRLGAYLSRWTTKRIALVMGAKSLLQLFDEQFYANLDGGILESFGRLFKHDLHLYVYPWKDDASGELRTALNLPLQGELGILHRYLVERGVIVPLDRYDPVCLEARSRDALARIAKGDASWETMVPPHVAEVIKRNGYLGWRDPSVPA